MSRSNVNFRCPNCNETMPLEAFGKCSHCSYGTVTEGHVEKIPQTLVEAINDAFGEFRIHLDYPRTNPDVEPITAGELLHREVIFLIERAMLKMKEENRLDTGIYEAVINELRNRYE